MKAILPIVFLMLVAIRAGLPQQPANPTASTGTLEGTVVRALTRSPIAGAVVTLKAADRSAVGDFEIPDGDTANPIDPPGVFKLRTDALGKFSFRNIEPGRYFLIASHDEYLRVEYGQRAPNQPGKALVIAPGPKEDDIRVEMVPAAAIFGTIRDPLEEPLAGVFVQAYRQSNTLFGPRFTLARSGTTNDRGEYRLFGVEPGRYLIAADYDDSAQKPLLPGVRLTPNLVDPGAGYAVQYFPGYPDIADGEIVRVGSSADLNAPMKLKGVQRGYVRGHVLGMPETGARVWLLSSKGELVPGYWSFQSVRNDGAFQFGNVSPGSYVIAAETTDRTMFSELTSITVGSQGVDDLRVALRTPLFIQGEGLPGTIVRLVRIGQSSDAGGMFSMPVNPSGNTGIFPIPKGEYNVVVTGLPSDARVEKIELISRTPRLPRSPEVRTSLQIVVFGTAPLLTVRLPETKPPDGDCEPAPPLYDPHPRVCLQVSISRATGSIAGRVLSDSAVRSVAGARIVLVPQNGKQLPERYRLGIADEDGSFKLSDIPPGQYIAFAFEEIERGAYYDPEFVDRFRKRGTIVTVQSVQAQNTQRSASQTLQQVMLQFQIQLNLIPVADMGEWASPI